MKITAEGALQQSIRIWDWRADNPEKDPLQYENFRIDSPCPLCRYVNSKFKWKADCEYCPMYQQWSTATGYANTCSGPLEYSAYSAFIDDDNLNYDRSFFALILVEDFELRLEWLLNHGNDMFN